MSEVVTGFVSGDAAGSNAGTGDGPMTPAERMRRHRQRKREAAEAAARQAHGSWPPFEEGNTAAVVHGGRSARLVDPLSAQIVAELLDGPDCPEHLREGQGRWRHAMAAWGRAEAQCILIATWIAGQDVEAALTEVTRAAETTEHRKGGSTKRTTGKRVEAALSALDRAERRAAGLRNDLGLTPASAARMKVQVTPKFDLAMEIMRLEQEGGTGGR
jgi:hypothetical protein